MATLWLTKLILAHLLTDFILQPGAWVKDRMQRHFASPWLYVHTLLTAFVALVFIGWTYWPVAIIILVTHTLIDGWKSYQPAQVQPFLIDQSLHLLVILACWWFSFHTINELVALWVQTSKNEWALIHLTAFVFLSYPAAILIGQLTSKWRNKLDKAKDLEDAGKWIGIIERSIILVLVLLNEYQAIGLLIAAKGVIRFSDNERTEQKTEYLLIGTLISFSLAIITGLLVKQFAG